ncbi:CDP-alcohol phosphatidyltransferase family protein [Mycolicibacterium monacense]|uniref:CDP-diacylglycerol--glycerol-3-phosphate 3-phosphatidyltransferase n=4 Tax=Mycobacteriaceae TaxID=1762 RepID=A0AAD1IT42_MYCMB|nr:CDP-alcohol phosphatidyltransferase family protein [Mycolicibacterium monacense]MDA4101749.1 CDP-diacylglycerol--glycerol-3-phosphate 3-phosphatidyl-transferase [Mycolicibacterium monacense DSM 44395]OBB58186.1 CDP-diacylglycerol--glycerol-3-phosphate 3-phosphatidyltransferase [Mycolicibacterium monacense]OBF50243.1 CDP-diacylglycerol--glycerol-3-phosphate 3-phosphatidyltransferase [Mycolicibacterium monacense]ORB13777.1 CDP-diacylglycerol--glycerol-3-phosphate 3-phosphatidyltransferase [Myc
MDASASGERDRVLTVPNALSVLRLVLVPVFLWLLFGAHANAWAVGVLMFSGFSDWADGKIARLVDNQSSRLGELLDPLVDRIYMVTVPLALAVHGTVPWWFVVTLLGRDVVLAATLPLLRSRGLAALPVTYLGKAATFALMSGFPLVLLGQWDALWSRVVLACGWGFLGWGMALYLWSGVLYLVQVVMVAQRLPKVRTGG